MGSRDNSILDRILTSKQTEAMEHLSPSETVHQLLKMVTEKEADVLNRRYGLAGQKNETLEDIGVTYKVTRERIRQIERLAVQKVKASREFDHIVQPIKAAVTQVLTTHGGFLEERSLLKTLLQIAGDNQENSNAMLFLLHELLNEHFERIEANRQFFDGWKMRNASLTQFAKLIDRVTAFFETVKHPLPMEAFLQRFRASPEGTDWPGPLADEMLLSLFDLAKPLGHNPFGEYGLATWGQIHPRRMNDKIYLVLKRQGKPMHFTEIATAINEVGFDDRRAYPPTVHNELILDRKYVLVGRGIYALGEWGYQPGIVADVLTNTLQQAGHPMTRDELVAAVLKQRLVKRNTIHLALTNRQHFVKNPDGTYALNQHQTNAAATDRH